jgi:hypothetical protein
MHERTNIRLSRADGGELEAVVANRNSAQKHVWRATKAMARTLRAFLVAKGLKITISQSLELIAGLFGVADWNTLAAAIRRETLNHLENASPSSIPTAERTTARSPDPPWQRRNDQRGQPVFSAELELTLHRAFALANERDHEYTTLEHLLLVRISVMVSGDFTRW